MQLEFKWFEAQIQETQCIQKNFGEMLKKCAYIMKYVKNHLESNDPRNKSLRTRRREPPRAPQIFVYNHGNLFLPVVYFVS